VLECIRMSERPSDKIARIFVKILFQELCAYMGLPKLNQRLKDHTHETQQEGRGGEGQVSGGWMLTWRGGAARAGNAVWAGVGGWR
ncbi:pre-mRNA-splicing factor CWC22 homolog, partial [Lates japonicus]